MIKKTKKGFTLVEVIVVAVIVAILAAVAIPIYLNYVTTSRGNAANNCGGAIATFCGACANASGTLGGFTSGTAMTTGGIITCTSTAAGNSSSQVPANIDVTITGTTGGTVTAVHEDGGASHTHNW